MADPAARRLATGRSFLIGLHTFTATFPVDLQSSYYPFLVGVEEEAAAKGYDLLFTGLSGSEVAPGRESALSRLQLADGAILIGRHPRVGEVDRLLEDGFPLVYIGRREEFGDRLPYVGADYVRASADLVRHLHALGHRRILYVREPDEAVAATDREQGFLAGLAAVALAAGPDSVVRTDGSDLTVDQLRGWLDSGITAVVAEGTDTLTASRALQATAAAAGLRCPEDFSLALTGEQVYPQARRTNPHWLRRPPPRHGPRGGSASSSSSSRATPWVMRSASSSCPARPSKARRAGHPHEPRRRDGLPPDR
jgi:DNA-binding LacI/PurR family transcriptional regulator